MFHLMWDMKQVCLAATTQLWCIGLDQNHQAMFVMQEWTRIILELNWIGWDQTRLDYE